MPPRFASATPDAVPIWFAHAASWDQVRVQLSETAAGYAGTAHFEAKPGKHLVVHDGDGLATAVLAGLEPPDGRHRDLFLPGRLATVLPAATYRFANAPHDAALGALGWLLSRYHFGRYKAVAGEGPGLVVPDGVNAGRLERIAAGAALARDLVNTPTNDLGPQALEEAATAMAHAYGATVNAIRGDDLLAENLPLIHAVGRAATQPPRLVDIRWGAADAPKVTLVGKGVTFDTGGLDIKPESGMALMKKDMGGAATALALARTVMDAGLRVRLRVLLPIVENAISADAFRPGDVYRSRKGLSVEIGNTDAEGRLILADALALADEEAPELLFDFATLTGAARVALGPDLPPFFTDDEALAAAISHHSEKMFDPVWRLPLWEPYDATLDGKISDLKNIGGNPFAGAIVAALFLRRFVERTRGWAHFDIYAWNPTAQSGRPEGGETQASRLLYDLLETRFGT